MIRLAICLALCCAVPAQAEPQIECVDVDPETRDKVRAIVLTALDEALKEHVTRMYYVWMRDEASSAGRLRARQGTRIGIQAYARARALILSTQWTCPK